MEIVYKPGGMNIELTTSCPLRCPQCYCSLEGGRHIPLETVKNTLEQAARAGVKHVEFSGGETMCYPSLYEVVRFARENGIAPNIAISGWHFDEEAYINLVNAGIEGIFVSLNGPTEEVNRLSRDGYHYAVSALEILKRMGFEKTMLNWVMHRNNADFFPQMIDLAEHYHVNTIVIMAAKPTAKHELNTLPTKDQMYQIANIVKQHKGKVKMGIETCFSPLLALVSDNKLWGNRNCGPNKGCAAGRSALSLSVDGLYSPCRHLEYFEKWDSLEEYWTKSPILQKLRTLEESKMEPCASCRFCNYCRHCIAINSKLNNDLYIGNELCPLAESCCTQ